MKKLSFFSALMALVLFLPFGSQAQISTPAASPTMNLSTKVGLTDVSIEYSRPSVKDRDIFAKGGLVPFGEMWRTGANKNTMFTFGDDVMLGGKEVKAGTYALFTIPDENEWTIILYEDTNNWGIPKEYDAKKEAARFMVKPGKTGKGVETFTINITDVTYNSANINLSWEFTSVDLPLKVEVNKMVQKEFDRLVNGPNAADYYNMAAFYHESGQDLNKALEYVEKATMGDDPKFWQVRRKSLILADLGKYKEAVDSAKQSLALAQKAGNMDYVRMNEKSIADWTKKMK
jgi:hypothetical protein